MSLFDKKPAAGKQDAAEAANAVTVSPSGYDLRPISDSLKQTRAEGLTAEERRVLLEHGTERAFCGHFNDNKKDGVYACRLCGLPLFRSTAKFDSGTGWPSFFEPFDASHVRNISDYSYGMIRTEIRCRRCDGHLGHVFNDGPKPSGQRYCLNSVSMAFFDNGQPIPQHVDAA
ncbi:MAG: peptide-methionine (R)-S-oxide reductase [Xanthomonadaceae bacterium]|nr:peptide-methionine (R)-S-oxide reductase [Xanthomonadaceae bacterium]